MISKMSVFWIAILGSLGIELLLHPFEVTIMFTAIFLTMLGFRQGQRKNEQAKKTI